VRLADFRAGLDVAKAGEQMYDCVTELYPYCRSITGDGLRQTLRDLGRRLPLTLHEVPSGTQVLDWIVPPEWTIRDAWIKDARGRRVVDFQASNLHVVSYSVPVRARMSLAELRPRLHTLPEHPDWIPYRTSYYTEDWGFCLTARTLVALPEGEYDVCIDSTLAPGSLTYGECVLPGERDEEVLLSCHVCHPSLCNDNLAGAAVAAMLGHCLAGLERRYTYRVLFVPGTIGSIAWLSRHEADVPRIKHGLVLSGLGDGGHVRYKRSRRGDAVIDRAAAHVLRGAGVPGAVADFSPWGYDERQYCSPGFDLPVGCLTRTPHDAYPEYHTSADDLTLVSAPALADSLDTALAVLEVLEHDGTFVNTSPKGEPQLGPRGLYRAMGGGPQVKADGMTMLWVLNLSDGRASLLDIAERSGAPFESVRRMAALLEGQGLLRPASGEAARGRS
jgi:aminopeptidase-like protein